MNFHWELRKGRLRRNLDWLRILAIRRHELVIGRSPTWAPCRIRYYPPWAASTSTAPRGSISAGRTHWPPQSSCLPTPIQAKYCPETGF